MSWHASAEDLARYFEGDLKPRKAAKIASHLPGCAQCTELSQQLQAVPALLATVQYPPMPANLSSRIEMAIAGESAARIASEPASEAGRRDLPARARHARPTWRMPGLSSPRALRVMAATGAALIVAGGGYAIAINAGSGPQATSTAGGSSAAAPSAASAPLTFGPNLPYEHAGHTDTIRMVQSATNFTPGTFRTQTLAAVKGAQPSRSHSASNQTYGAGSSQTASPLASPQGSAGPTVDALSGCVNVIAAGRRVLLAETAKFEGSPAMIIVVESSAHQAEAFAVRTGCTASNNGILFSQSLPGV